MGRPEAAQEESQRLLGSAAEGSTNVSSRPETGAAPGPAAAAPAAAQPAAQAASTEKPPAAQLIIPVAAPVRERAEVELAASASTSSSSSAGGPKELGLCRICLEEDCTSNLEQPCACTGTQKYAHHACIQRWVNEKGHLRCEICDSEYQGAFTVPPQAPAGVDDQSGVFALAIRVDHDPMGGHGSQDRAPLDFLDESDHLYQRNPLASWCFTFVIFIMFLAVLHHTMIVADGMDTTTSSTASPGAPPSTSSPMEGSDADEYAASLTLFLFWIGTKAFLIGIPLYTVMRLAARQARRESYEAMLRHRFDAPRRRFVWRMQVREADRRAAAQSGVA